MTVSITASVREATGKAAKHTLNEGQLPAVVYGPKQSAQTICVPLAAFQKILREEGESSVVTLEGLGKEIQALVHEVQRDPVTNQPSHVDFYAIEKGAKVEVAIPLTFVGESFAVKTGASLVKVLHEIEVQADPSKLPHDIEVDLSLLAATGDHINVRDVKLPEGVIAMTDADEVVAIAQESSGEESAEGDTAPDISTIEVEKKGKTDEV